MDIFRQQQLQQAIATRLAEALSRYEWVSVNVLWSEVGWNSHSRFAPLDANGKVIDVMPPEFEEDFEILRAEMADPATGAWFSAEFTMTRDGAMAFRFNYDDRVYWLGGPGKPDVDIMPNDQDYLDDLERFPRDPQHIPDWFPTTVTPPGEGQGAAIEALLTAPLTVPARYEPLRSAAGWPDVLTSTHAAILKNVRDASGDISLEADYRPRLADVLGGTVEFISEYVYDEVLADRPVSALQDLVIAVGPVIENADTAPVTVAPDTLVRDAGDDLGVSDLLDRVYRVVGDIALADLESRFGVRPVPR